jgi:hypothetical protein
VPVTIAVNITPAQMALATVNTFNANSTFTSTFHGSASVGVAFSNLVVLNSCQNFGRAIMAGVNHPPGYSG